MRPLLLLLLAAAVGAPAFSQRIQRHQFTAGLGAAVPGGDLKNYYQPAFSWTVGYGYRILPFLQADFAYDGSYKAANVDAYYNTPQFGSIRIRDFQIFLPIGGRVVAPIAKGRVEIFGGGGWAYMKYTEALQQPSPYYRVDCPVCSERSGYGYYTMFGGNVALDRAKNFRIGAFTRVYQGHTEGMPVGSLVAYRSSDRWVNTYGTFTFSF